MNEEEKARRADELRLELIELERTATDGSHRIVQIKCPECEEFLPLYERTTDGRPTPTFDELAMAMTDAVGDAIRMCEIYKKRGELEPGSQVWNVARVLGVVSLLFVLASCSYHPMIVDVSPAPGGVLVTRGELRQNWITGGVSVINKRTEIVEVLKR